MYVTQAQIQTEIPPSHLIDALDDDGSGALNLAALNDIIASASQAVEAFLAGIYATPFPDPAPAAVREAAFTFCCERIYGRRPGKDNPWTARANAWRERLVLIGERKEPLDNAIPVATGLAAAASSQPVVPGRVPIS